MGFIILVTCYQVGYWTRHYYICIRQMSQEVEKELHYWEYEHDFFISQSCIKLSKDSFFARSFIKVMLPGGKKNCTGFQVAISFLPAQTTGSIWAMWKVLVFCLFFLFFFFFPPQAPSSVQYLLRLPYRGRWREEKKYSTNRCPNSWIAPLFFFSFLKGVISTEVFGKTKEVLCFCMKNKSLIY